MDIVLAIHFDTLIYDSFEIRNPPIVPLQGVIFNCNWGDFIDDDETVKKIEEWEDNHCWVVDILSQSVSKKEICFEIVLTDIDDYKLYFK